MFCGIVIVIGKVVGTHAWALICGAYRTLRALVIAVLSVLGAVWSCVRFVGRTLAWIGSTLREWGPMGLCARGIGLFMLHQLFALLLL